MSHRREGAGHSGSTTLGYVTENISCKISLSGPQAIHPFPCPGKKRTSKSPQNCLRVFTVFGYLCKFSHVLLSAHVLSDVSFTVESCPLLIAFSKFNLHVRTSYGSQGLGFYSASVEGSSIIPVETHTPYVGLNPNHANTFN